MLAARCQRPRTNEEMSNAAALDALSRSELIERARELGVERPERMTRAELRDEILRLSAPRGHEEEARGLFGVARSMLANVVEAGLHMPDAAAVIRGEAGFDVRVKTQPPVATVTLAEIYAAQGHRRRAVRMLDDVLAAEPDHEHARELRQRLADELAGRVAVEGEAPPVAAELVETTGEEIRTGKPPLVASAPVRVEPEAVPPAEDDLASSVEVPSEVLPAAAIPAAREVAPTRDAPAGFAPEQAPSEEEPPAKEDAEPENTGSSLEEPKDEPSHNEPPASHDAAPEAVHTPLDPPVSEVLHEPTAERAPEPVEGELREPTAEEAPEPIAEEPSESPEEQEAAALVAVEAIAAQVPLDEDVAELPRVEEVSEAASPSREELESAAPGAPSSPTSPSEPPEQASSFPLEGPPEDVLFVESSDAGVGVYWELSRASLDRVRRRMPEGEPVLRLVALRPSWEGSERFERVVALHGETGLLRFSEFESTDVVRAAVGWRSPEGFVPLAVASDLVGGYRPPLVPKNFDAALARARVRLDGL